MEEKKSREKKFSVFQITSIVLSIMLAIFILISIFIIVDLKQKTDDTKYKNNSISQTYKNEEKLTKIQKKYVNKINNICLY